MEEFDSPSVLLQLMGITEDYQDPSNVRAEWSNVSSRLNSHPQEASIMHPGGISYPLNLALCNRLTPAPAFIIQKFIECYPEAVTLEDFGNACRYAHTTGDILRILLEHHRGRPSKDLIKRWDLDWIASNNNENAAKALIYNYEAAQPSSIKEWREMRPSSHSFWFTLLMRNKCRCVTEERIKSERLLQFFILQGNYKNVELILDTYPKLLSVTSWRAQMKQQLPIHTALSSTSATEYRPWHNRSPIVKLLLRRGFESKVGGENGCGGLYVKDSHETAMTYAINAGLNSRWEDPERRKCLEICLQFAHANMYGRSASQIEFDLPMLHAAIAVVPVHTFKLILRKYGITTLDKDKKGRTALFHLIDLMTDRPTEGYATAKSVMANKRREREREVTDRNLIFARNRWGQVDGFEHFLQHQGRQSLEAIAGRLWDREQEVLEDTDLDLVRANRQTQIDNGNGMLPDVLQRLVDAAGERDRNDFLDVREDANVRLGRFGGMFMQAAAHRNRGMNARAQEPAPDVLHVPSLIPFIFQPLRPLLESNTENAPANVESNSDAVDPVINIQNNAQPAAPENDASNPVQAVEIGHEEPNPNNAHHAINEVVRPHRARWGNGPRIFNRRPFRRRRMANNLMVEENEEDVQTVSHPNDDSILRNMIEARDRELDELDEKMIEKKYFRAIRNILLDDVQEKMNQNKTKNFTNCAKVEDYQNRLPIHYAAEKGLFTDAFQDILTANPEAVCEADGWTKLYPFALAASAKAESPQLRSLRLDASFDLLLRNPSVMDK